AWPSRRPSGRPLAGLEDPGLEIHLGCGEKALRANDHDFGNSRSRVRVVLLSGDSPPGEQSMNVRILTSVAAVAALALSLSACQKKADEASTSAPAADSSSTAASTASTPPAADASATAAAPATPPAEGSTAAAPPATGSMSSSTPP